MANTTNDSPKAKDASKQNKSFKLTAIAVVALASTALLLFFWPEKDNVPQKRGGGAVPVLTVTINTESSSTQIEALGSVLANEFAEIRSKVTERIESIHFSDGQSVSKGQLLFELNMAEQAAELAEAEATLDERASQLERVRQVEGSGALSQSVVDEERARYNVAKARVDLFKARINDRRIVAPFDGEVGLRLVSPGTLVTSNDLLITLTDNSLAKVDFTLPERYLGSIQTGQRLRATSVAYPNTSFEGEIESINPYLDTQTRAMLIRGSLANPERLLKQGMLLKVYLSMPPRDTLFIPEEAIIHLENKHFVYKADKEGKAERIPVTIGERADGRVEILSGLKDGDTVVTEGHRVRPGSELNILEPEDAFRATPNG